MQGSVCKSELLSIHLGIFGCVFLLNYEVERNIDGGCYLVAPVQFENTIVDKGYFLQSVQGVFVDRRRVYFGANRRNAV